MLDSFLIGFIFGVLVFACVSHIKKPHTDGLLRMYKEEGSENLYLFTELAQGPEEIMQKRYVIFEVDTRTNNSSYYGN